MTTGLHTQEFIDAEVRSPGFAARFDAAMATTNAVDEDGFPVELDVDGYTRFLSRTTGR